MNQAIIYTRLDSPIGLVWLAASQVGVCAIGLGSEQPGSFFSWLSKHVGPEPPHDNRQPLTTVVNQLREYFSSTRREFDLPLDIRGTDFQKAVWAEVALIPYRTTETYGEIARRIGKPGAARAVGGAVGANPLPVLIPCHRVMGAGGRLTGYGAGLEIKAALLQVEGTRPIARAH